MARQRRGRGGFNPTELRGTLGTLLRTTREVLERGAREGRERLDEALASRRRDAALAQLGEAVLDLIRAGEIDLAELPEVRDIVARLDDLDAAHDVEHDARPAPAPVRDRFDRRHAHPHAAMADDGTVSALPTTPAAPTKKAKQGGISFDDEDLGDYMHPDDVPPKGGSDRNS
jgi:hypothetical protein